ncbi:hypothetical protein [Changchengzhania lutea]|uniref:hypothetical protein n=1 Tax=Changchengzhania lutea TaxID=2049305 RepID=UPI00115C9714|nr:hypothetical protein [Changchengzhania lutea]
MKRFFLLFILSFLALSGYGQIDNEKKSIIIPAVESKKDSASVNVLLPASPKTNSNKLNGLSVPRVSTNMETPKKEFSMFGETFGNPGEQYEGRLNKQTKNIEVEAGLGSKGSKTDQYFGDFKSKSEYVRLLFRDFGLEDGDIISILVNDETIQPRILLTNGYKSVKLTLLDGFNKIDFLALNEGYSLPNTAEFQVIDDKGIVLAANQWNLSAGVKATIIVVKE